MNTPSNVNTRRRCTLDRVITTATLVNILYYSYSSSLDSSIVKRKSCRLRFAKCMMIAVEGRSPLLLSAYTT